MTQNVWFYWDDGIETAPPVLHSCVYTALINSDCQVRILNQESYLNNFSGIDPALFRALRPSHQCEIVRVHVIQQFGGMYLDCDTIVVNSLKPLFSKLRDYEYVAGSYVNPEKPARSGPVGVTILGPSRPYLNFIRLSRLEQLNRLEQARDELLSHPWIKANSIRRFDDIGNKQYPLSYMGIADMISSKFADSPAVTYTIDGFSTWYSYFGHPTWQGGKFGHVYQHANAGVKIQPSDLYTFTWSGALEASMNDMSTEEVMGLGLVLSKLLKLAGLTGGESVCDALQKVQAETCDYLANIS